MFKTIRSFGREIYNNDLSLDDALEQQIRLKDDIAHRANICSWNICRTLDVPTIFGKIPYEFPRNIPK